MHKYLVKVTYPWGIIFYGKGGEKVAGIGQKRIKKITDNRLELYGFRTEEGAERSRWYKIAVDNNFPVEIVCFIS